MNLLLHPDMLAAAYEYLRATPPFDKWGLPESDEVDFDFVHDPKMYADFSVESGKLMIRVSAHDLVTIGSILPDIAHEMIHLYQHGKKLDRGAKPNTHNADFKRRAKRVCAIHGFDLRTF